MSASDSWLIAKVEPHLRCNIGSLEQLIIIKIISVNNELGKHYGKIIFRIFLCLITSYKMD